MVQGQHIYLAMFFAFGFGLFWWWVGRNEGFKVVP
jgi:hypothetical protein